jgi:hypothetical protein
MRDSKDIEYRQEAGGYSDKNTHRDKKNNEKEKDFFFFHFKLLRMTKPASLLCVCFSYVL